MSFKREGDDPSQLGVLQRRRVTELLARGVPEEEALLLRSGRYACTVCAHRPVFDTLAVLTLHRAGRKHAGHLQRFYSHKRSCQDVAPKQEVQAEAAGVQGSPAPLLARTRQITRSALLKEAPYSSCCRRTAAQGSSSRAGIPRTGPNAAPTSPEPLQMDREAVIASPAALLPGHRGTQADAPRAAPVQTQRGGKAKASLSQPDALSPERRRVLERYLQLRSAGWIQDGSGKWVKDENAEFDSDEEEPPVLLPA
ncbi:sodium channel modifier 1 [Cuculus canorus]|uniref:sodium channel modifier 1 n=1 Tax=Cuculus canorus TaxID=55661 RepID=UPI0023AA6CB8|nr:sodium channel modifier 1 [Cuculus canorus]